MTLENQYDEEKLNIEIENERKRLLEFDSTHEIVQQTPAPIFFHPLSSSIYELEKSFILEVLRVNGNNKTKSASELGITLKTLYNKLHDYGQMKTKTKGEEQ